MERIVVTGCAGFIGMNLCRSLCEEGFLVLGLDDLNDYYDVKLKEDRLGILKSFDNFEFFKIDIADFKSLKIVFKNFNPSKVVNLAAQAGVRHSLKNPHIYIKSNIVGFMNVLECCRIFKIKGLVYASSSSVYGNLDLPFKESKNVNSPISIYASTKISNEMMARSYNHLYGLNATGLRFFTVYGPWGRPDMAVFIFTDRINKGLPISLFNKGNLHRDFTYIDDIVYGIKSSIKNNFNFEIINLGNNNAINLMDLVILIEKELGLKAKINFEDMQIGDIKKTKANIEHAQKLLDYNPKTSIDKGVSLFVSWYKEYIGS